MNIKVEVDAGVCGFQTCVRAASEDGQNVVFDVASGCEKIRGLADALQANGAVDAFQEISPDGPSVVMRRCGNDSKAVAPAVPCPPGFSKRCRCRRASPCPGTSRSV